MPTPDHAPVLLVTSDDLLLDDVLRLAAAAGAPLEVAHDTPAALRGWSAASVVLVGADEAAGVAVGGPPRRPEVHVVSRGPAPDPLFRDALALGARAVVELPAADTWLVELLTDVHEGAGAEAWTLGVVAGSGGAGASTFAAAAALVSAREAPTLLLDLDPWGPGLDRIAGIDEVDGVRWDALLASSGRLGSRALRAALPQRDGLALLTFGPADGNGLEDAAVREVLSAARRGSDVVVVDLPRSVGGVAAEVAARCDVVAVVVQGTVPSVASAGKLAARLARLGVECGVVVRTSNAGLDPAAVSGALDLPLLADYPSRRRVVEHVDLGMGPVRSSRAPLARAAAQLLRERRP